MKTIHYPNKTRSHLVTIAPMAPFTPKSTSNLRSALYFRYPNNHYKQGFHNIFDYNHFTNSDYLLCTMTASAHIIH